MGSLQQPGGRSLPPLVPGVLGCASGAYLMNDLFDLAADREHPTKRHRALAAGDLKISSALSAIPALWTFAVAAGLYSLRIGAGAVAAGVVLSE